MRKSKTLEERGAKRASGAPVMADVQRENFELASIHECLQEAEGKSVPPHVIPANTYHHVHSCELAIAKRSPFVIPCSIMLQVWFSYSAMFCAIFCSKFKR